MFVLLLPCFPFRPTGKARRKVYDSGPKGHNNSLSGMLQGRTAQQDSNVLHSTNNKDCPAAEQGAVFIEHQGPLSYTYRIDRGELVANVKEYHNARGRSPEAIHLLHPTVLKPLFLSMHPKQALTENRKGC
ncbi:hypothetical protein WJX79_007629 [Trebouxia sp. C0005]